jgi:ABC-type antimicrobial peptide transport system permease subunit
MILLWIRDEVTFDGFHKNLPYLFRVMENQYYSEGEMFTFAATPGPMAPKLKNDFPEISRATRMTWAENELLRNENKSLYFDARYVDQDFLDMFTFEVIEGDLSGVLTDQSSMVITKKVADAFFGTESALGKSFSVEINQDYKVSAVIENIPSNSSYPFDLLLPIEIFFEDNPWANEWQNNNLRTFLQLHKGTDWAMFNNKIKNYINENREETTNIEIFLQPYSEIHLYSDFRPGRSGGGRITYVRIFSIVGLFIIFIASINFMNLATALSTQRAREVGIRKISGSNKRSLIQQFLLETLIIAWIALLIALLLVYFLLPAVNMLTEKKMMLDIQMIGWSVGLSVLTGLLAGIYPAFYIKI